jgi:hypothetical protein
MNAPQTGPHYDPFMVARTGTAKAALTAEVVANMSDEDFAAISADPKKWRQLFR